MSAWFSCLNNHDVLTISINLSNIAILNIHSADFGITKIKATLQNVDLTEKGGTL